jgi:hypothetical protein
MIPTILSFVIFIAVCSPVEFSPQEKPATEMAAIISSLSGEASVIMPSAPGRKSLRLFDWLPAGSVVEVGTNSRLIIAFSNGRRYQMEAGTRAALAGGTLKALAGAVRDLPSFPPMPRLAAIDRAAQAGVKAGAIRIRGDKARQIRNLYPRADTSALPDETTLLFSPTRETARYKVELEDELGRTVFSAEIESVSLVVPRGILKPGARYYWRVRSVEIVGPAARGESEFMTLPIEEIEKRAVLRDSLKERGGIEALALLAEIDRRLGLLLEARNEFRAALSQSPSDETLRRMVGELEKQLHPEDPDSKL